MTDSGRQPAEKRLEVLLDEIIIAALSPPQGGFPVRIISSPQLYLLAQALETLNIPFYLADGKSERAVRLYQQDGVTKSLMEYEIDLSQINITLL